MWVRATLPPGKRKTGNIEMYDRKRYVTVTGHHLPGTPTTIEERQAELETLHAEYLGTDNQDPATLPRPSSAPVDLDDGELLERARGARNGAKFDRLWNGDTSEHGGDESAADLALWASTARCRHPR